MIMTKSVHFAIFATLLLIGASTAIARPAERSSAGNIHNPYWTDESDPYGGYSPNSPQGNRAFWDYQGRHGN
jgi:hypothetical protein